MAKYKTKIPAGAKDDWSFLSKDFPFASVEVSEYGRVRFVRADGSHSYYSPKVLSDGHVYVYMQKKYWRVDRLNAAVNIKGKRLQDNECVIHEDGNKENNHYTNLKIVRRGELVEETVVMRSGPRADRVKWTAEQIGHLKYYLSKGVLPKDLTWLYGGSQGAINNLRFNTHQNIPVGGPDPTKDFLIDIPEGYEQGTQRNFNDYWPMSLEHFDATCSLAAKSRQWTHRQIGHIKYYLWEGKSAKELAKFYGGSEQSIYALRKRTHKDVPILGPDPAAAGIL